MLPLKLSEIANLVGGTLVGDTDPLLTGVSGLAEANENELSFLGLGKPASEANKSAAGGLFVATTIAVDKPCIQVEDPYRAFAMVLAGMDIEIDRIFPPGVHSTAVVDDTADVSGATAIGPYCVVGAGTILGAGTRLASHVIIGCDVVMGNDCVIYPQVVIREGCRLGDRVIVHASAVIGSDGFGYLPGAAGMQKVSQVGIVEVGDDVEFGAGVTVDRATAGRTVIGAGCKIDNQVQIAHNVQMGHHCALSAQVGIAGSCVVGDGVVFGGQVGVGDHLTIGSGTKLGGQSGVTANLAPGSRVFGTPAQDVKESFRTTAATRRLPQLQATVRELHNMVAQLEDRLAAVEGQMPPTNNATNNDQEN